MPLSAVRDSPAACLCDRVAIASFVSKGKNSFLKKTRHMFRPCIVKCRGGPYF